MAERKYQDAIDEAPGIVERFIGKRFVQAHEELTKEKHGKGCGCLSCRHRVVREANSWGDVAAGGNEKNPVTHAVNRHGKIVTRVNVNFGLKGGSDEGE